MSNGPAFELRTARLADAAEAWVRGQGLHKVMVRSNTARVESHPFYEGLGFVRRKSQHVYFKALD